MTPREEYNPTMRREKTIAFIIDLLLVIVPWGFSSTPVIWKIVLWSLAWMLALYLIFSLKGFNYLSTSAKVGRSFVLTILFAVIVELPMFNMWRAEKASVMTGELEVAPSSDPNSPPVISFGPETDGARWTWGGTNGSPMFRMVGDVLILRKSYGKLLITTHVRDRDGKIIVDIVDNKWRVSPDTGISWDKNYTANALEVEDGRGRVVFQIVLRPDAAYIQGEWWNENKVGARVLRPYPFDRSKVGPIFQILTPTYHPDDPRIEPVFKYSSKEHLGEFADWFTLQP
jgi:hypothetical protein